MRSVKISKLTGGGGRGGGRELGEFSRYRRRMNDGANSKMSGGVGQVEPPTVDEKKTRGQKQPRRAAACTRSVGRRSVANANGREHVHNGRVRTAHCRHIAIRALANTGAARNYHRHHRRRRRRSRVVQTVAVARGPFIYSLPAVTAANRTTSCGPDGGGGEKTWAAGFDATTTAAHTVYPATINYRVYCTHARANRRRRRRRRRVKQCDAYDERETPPSPSPPPPPFARSPQRPPIVSRARIFYYGCCRRGRRRTCPTPGGDGPSSDDRRVRGAREKSSRHCTAETHCCYPHVGVDGYFKGNRLTRGCPTRGPRAARGRFVCGPRFNLKNIN